MSWPSLIMIVRHGQSEGNVLSPDQRAKHNIPTHKYSLTPKGIVQVEQTRKWLELGGYLDYNDAYFTSYYLRSTQTMEHLFPGKQCIEDSRLAEANRGIHHVMTKSQLIERYPEELERRVRDGLYHFRPLGGESWPDVELRIHSFIDTLRRDYHGKSVVIAGHGTWMALFERIVRRLTINECVTKCNEDPIHNGEVHFYKGTGRHLRLEQSVRPCKDGACEAE